jgi:transposase
MHKYHIIFYFRDDHYHYFHRFVDNVSSYLVRVFARAEVEVLKLKGTNDVDD